MEVNVDVLEQMDLMDVSDQEALDVFLNSGSSSEEGGLVSALPGASCWHCTYFPNNPSGLNKYPLMQYLFAGQCKVKCVQPWIALDL